MRAKETVDGNRGGENKEKIKQGAFLGGKEEKGEGRCGTDRGGMKGKGTIRSKKARGKLHLTT